MVPGRKRPLRHLVSCSQELADSTSDGKLLLISEDHLFIWSSLVRHHGLPATPEWGPRMISQLQQQKRIQPLLGFWICRSSGQGQAESVIGAASDGAAQQSARVSCRKWGRRMVRNPTHQENCLIPA